MKRNLTILAALFLLWNFSTTTWAQTPESTPTKVITQDRSVKNLPYSAEGTSETVQTLADGNKIKKIQKQKMFRDSQGRTRSEFESIIGGRKLLSIYIGDPIAGFRYRLDTDRKTAIRTPLNPQRTTVTVAPPRQGYSYKSEDLGSKVINGIEAKGWRSVRTVAAGTEGNEKEFQTINEYWTSSELRVMIYSKNNDPRNGEQIFQLENMKREEPDTSLFKVPEDYKIIEQEMFGTFIPSEF